MNEAPFCINGQAVNEFISLLRILFGGLGLPQSDLELKGQITLSELQGVLNDAFLAAEAKAEADGVDTTLGLTGVTLLSDIHGDNRELAYWSSSQMSRAAMRLGGMYSVNLAHRRLGLTISGHLWLNHRWEWSATASRSVDEEFFHRQIRKLENSFPGLYCEALAAWGSAAGPR